MRRLSKRTVFATTAFLILGCLCSLAALVVELRSELGRASLAIQDLEAESQAQAQAQARVETQLSDVDRELGNVRQLERKLREVLSRGAGQGQDVADLEADLSTLEAQIHALREAAAAHGARLEAGRGGDPALADSEDARYRELMTPTVQVNGQHEVGSGTVLWSRLRGEQVSTFVLSAWHIVQDDEPPADGGPLEFEVYFYDRGQRLRTEQGRIVARDVPLDLTLIEVTGDHVYPEARIPSRADLGRLRVFGPVYAIGCPLGYPPLPTSGELTSLGKEEAGQVFWMVNAPTIFGNSGGGIYDAKSNALIGVLARISAYKNRIDVAVPHMGLVTPLTTVYQWLDEVGYGFTYRDHLRDPSKSARTVTAGASR